MDTQKDITVPVSHVYNSVCVSEGQFDISDFSVSMMSHFYDCAFCIKISP